MKLPSKSVTSKFPTLVVPMLAENDANHRSPKNFFILYLKNFLLKQVKRLYDVGFSKQLFKNFLGFCKRKTLKLFFIQVLYANIIDVPQLLLSLL